MTAYIESLAARISAVGVASELHMLTMALTDWAKLHPRAKALAAEIGLVVMFGNLPTEQLDLLITRSRAFVVDLEAVRMIERRRVYEG